MKLERKTILLLLGGGALLLTGAALSVFAHSSIAKIVSSGAVVAGIVIARLAGTESTWFGTVHGGQPRQGPWSWIDRVEIFTYVAAGSLFVLVIVAAANKFFDDRLTYTFAAAVILATAFWFCRRIFRLF